MNIGMNSASSSGDLIKIAAWIGICHILSMEIQLHIREEKNEDHKAVYAINASAFETSAEASLVDILRAQANPLISLVAVENGIIVGHIMFTPVTLSTHSNIRMMGLAPMAVSPDHQRRGIGSKLVAAGLEVCRKLEVAAVIVLGHPDFYPRFGFEPASQFGIASEYDVPDDVFMALELQNNVLNNNKGTARYHKAFNSL